MATNIQKLLAKGRLKPILKEDESGDTLIIGYERHSRSRKSGQQFFLKTPLKIKNASTTKEETDP